MRDRDCSGRIWLVFSSSSHSYLLFHYIAHLRHSVFHHVSGLQASARALLPSPDTARTPKKQILTELKGRSSSTCDRSSVTHHAWLVPGRCTFFTRGYRAQQDKEKDIRQTPIQVFIAGSSHDGCSAERMHDQRKGGRVDVRTQPSKNGDGHFQRK